MATLPVNRSTANTRAEHIADHNEVHRLHNDLDGHLADDAAHAGAYPRGIIGSCEVVSNFGTASPAAVSIPGSTVPVTVGTRPVLVTVSGSLTSSAVSTLGSIVVYEDAVIIGDLHWTSPVASSYMALTKVMRRTPTPGLHAYQCYLASYFANGTVSLFTVDPTNIGLQIIVEEV